MTLQIQSSNRPFFTLIPTQMIKVLCASLVLFLFSLELNLAQAQDTQATTLDSNEMRILELIQKGQAALKNAQSRLIKRVAKKKTAALKEALKSFSFAHRFMTDLQLNNPSLSEQINQGYEKALSDPLIQKELKTIEADLIKALAAKDKVKAYEAALELSQLDARLPEYVYLMKVFNNLQPSQN